LPTKRTVVAATEATLALVVRTRSGLEAVQEKDKGVEKQKPRERRTSVEADIWA